VPATAGPSHLDISAREFERRLAAHGHAPDEITRLWNEIAAEETAERRLALGPMIAVYVGVLLVVAASAALIAIYWETLDPWGVLVLGVAYLAGSLVASELFRLRGFAQPAEIFEAVSVGFFAVIAYAVEKIVGLWPQGASEIGHIHQGITGIVIAGLVFGAVLLAVRPAPLVFVPLGLGTALLAADAAELAFGVDASDRQYFAFVLPVGLAWIGAGLWLDVTRRRSYATWAYWVGLAVTGISLINLVPKTVPGFALIGVLGALALFFSAFVRHWSFTVIGALGVLIAVSAGMRLLGGVAPLGAAALGIVLIFVGLRWAHWREPIREAVLSRLPGRVRTFVMRLAP